MKKWNWLPEAVSYLLASLFLFTAASKLFDLRHFVRAVDNQPFDNRLTPFIVFFVLTGELTGALLLLFRRTRYGGLLISALLMTIFTVYVGLATYHFFDRVPCGCAGVIQAMSWEQHLVFNIVFTLLAYAGLLLSKLKDSSDTNGLLAEPK